MIENPLKNLRIKNYYSYLLTIAGFVLIISLIYKPKVISQQKLIALCLITIVYGLVEWIRESQFNDRLKQINLEWQIFWDEQPMRSLAELNDPNYQANLRRKFKEKHGGDNLMSSHQFKTWVLFILYLALMIGAFYFI